MSDVYACLKEQPAEFFHLIPQVGVTHLHCTQDPEHNAVWDMAISPEGRVFFPACGESYISLYFRLYEYDKKNKSLIRHFAYDDRVMTNPNAIRTSKLHTAMSFIGGGRMLTTTHTTSPAPTHPDWMPYNYAGHPYEEYPGSMLMEYNYLTGESKCLGMFTPHDTTYGGAYDPKNGDYFSITWMRGIGYVYNIHTGAVRCLGQVSDSHTSRLFPCSDGHIYGSTSSGALFRYNTDIRDVEYLGVSAPDLMRHAVEVNGVLYFTTGPCGVFGTGQELYAYELKTRKLSVVGRAVPTAASMSDNPSVYLNAYGMAIDSKKRLWYSCMLEIPGVGQAGSKLYMWDFLNGKEPVDCGFLGTEKQTICIPSEMHICDDVLYIADSNHVGIKDVPGGILVIDLKEFVPALETAPRVMSHDYINYLPFPAECSKYYPMDDFAERKASWDQHRKEKAGRVQQFQEENNCRVAANSTASVSVWEKVGRENAAIANIQWQDDTHFTFWCGKDKSFKAQCALNKEGNIDLLDLAEAPVPEFTELKTPVPDVKLASVPGRRYLAEAESSVKMPDGSIFVGTKDTMVCLIKGDKVFGLGQVCSGGGVHSLDCTADGKVWGVAGHAEACGQVFSYSKDEGLVLRGIVPEVRMPNYGRIVTCYRPTTLALSPNGRYLAIGAADELGGVVVLDIQDK
ncbi:MAG: hypothetical protein IJA47_01560 [Oscillospiraceae bacterium]|nr:hypothetical protein [Oscillospiraceae bacterium]